MKKPVSQTVLPWLKVNLGKHCLAPLTGTDARALAAAVHTIELYSQCPSTEVISAFALIVRQMQPSTQELAYHAIAHVMDWSDRPRIWNAGGLPVRAACRLCAYEPDFRNAA
jgi:hypothetical protein